MSNETLTEKQRRALLQVAAGLAVSNIGLNVVIAATPEQEQPYGKVGDFNFLAGEWRISHKRLKSPGVWDEFKGEATCWTVLGGVGSIEELRIPARNFSGMGVRLLDVKRRVWVDYWINSTSGVLTPPGLEGVFKNGAGIFESDDEDEGKPIKVRGVWDRITTKSCRWYQATSRDAGKSWEENWLMDWVKV
jgi:hypothetical protein